MSYLNIYQVADKYGMPQFRRDATAYFAKALDKYFDTLVASDPSTENLRKIVSKVYELAGEHSGSHGLIHHLITKIMSHAESRPYGRKGKLVALIFQVASKIAEFARDLLQEFARFSSGPNRQETLDITQRVECPYCRNRFEIPSSNNAGNFQGPIQGYCWRCGKRVNDWASFNSVD